MATSVLHLTRDQITAIARGDQEAVRQIEAIIRYTRYTGFCDPVLDADITLDTTGASLTVDLPIGRYFVEFVAMLNVVGGSGADGAFVDDVTTATLAAGAYSVTIGDTAATVMAAAPRPGPYYFSGADGVLHLRGFIDVQQAGLVGFNCRVQGVPASVTLLAGSGLTTTMQKEAV